MVALNNVSYLLLPFAIQMPELNIRHFAYSTMDTLVSLYNKEFWLIRWLNFLTELFNVPWLAWIKVKVLKQQKLTTWRFTRRERERERECVFKALVFMSAHLWKREVVSGWINVYMCYTHFVYMCICVINCVYTCVYVLYTFYLHVYMCYTHFLYMWICVIHFIYMCICVIHI